MIKFNSMVFFFIAILCSFLTPIYVAQVSAATVSEIDSEETAIMAVVLDSTYSNASPGWVMVSSLTATFKCNPPSEIGLDVGGCNGMRFASETAEERLSIVQKEIPMVSQEIVVDLIKKNQESSVLSDTLPIPIKQVMYSPKEKTDLKYSGNPTFAVYFSRVGFDSSRTKALIYLGTINWTDTSKSFGQYVYLEKIKSIWTIKGHLKIWTF